MRDISLVLEKRKKKHINDDFGIEECWKQITEIFSQDEVETINYLNNCSKEDLYFISEVFEDISENLKSKKIIACLRKLDKKYPDLKMTSDINLAEEYI
ncbi:hypothetical protein [Sebaldella sp. S0638]|uniref:hypothetical protein n=1 Tax=Sebaldella sp. S0638 TaxID=2957809 RepID=UPI00209FDDDE|nr:hypothetical protein [Sebaldella sp. S0638]MCP1226635.1 hypothetical protein [Sebaldella sp. S0638]